MKVLDGTGEEPCILRSSLQQVIAKNTASYALFGRCVYENIKNQ